MAAKKGEQFARIVVTPSKAQEWLDAANIGNRYISWTQVERFANDMRAEAWGQTPEPIAFASDGRLLDGQHRLHAVIRSGKSIPFWVATECSSEAQKYMDNGRKRSMSDAYGFYFGSDLTKRAESISRAVMNMTASGKSLATRRQEAEYYTKHKDAIQFAVEATSGSVQLPSGKNRRIPASIGAVIARAYYTQDRESLMRFCDIIRTGMASAKSDVAAIRLRDCLMNEESIKNAAIASRAGSRWLYRRAEYLLDRFIKRSNKVSRSEISKKEIFLIPGEDGYSSL